MVSRVEPDCICIDEVAVDIGHHGKGYGGVLLRFADTLARHFDARKIRLYAIHNRVSLYEKFGYQAVVGAGPIPLDTDTYQLMERAILYHLRQPLP